MVFLPEASDFISSTENETKDLSEPLDGHFVSSLRLLCCNLDIWMSVGVHERVQDDQVCLKCAFSYFSDKKS